MSTCILNPESSSAGAAGSSRTKTRGAIVGMPATAGPAIVIGTPIWFNASGGRIIAEIVGGIIGAATAWGTIVGGAGIVGGIIGATTTCGTIVGGAGIVGEIMGATTASGTIVGGVEIVGGIVGATTT